jgi:hypothetical protein
LSLLPHRPRSALRRASLVALALALLAAVPVSGASGWLTDDPAYYVPSTGNVEITPILTVGEGVDGYEMVGIPDGLGAFESSRGGGEDGGRQRGGTFTVLMNHELGPAQGTVRDHGATGAFISRWVLNKRDLSVVSGDDQIKQVFTQDPVTGSWTQAPAYAFDRFCSADLPATSALFHQGWGTRELIYLNGEERRPPFSNPAGQTAQNYGHAWAHVVTGAENGRTYELNDLGEMSFENVVASPYPQQKTIVVGLDDSTNALPGAAYNPQNPPSEVYVYVGHKQRGGNNPVERAGLSGGDLFGVKVQGHPTEATVAGGEHFDLALMSDAAQDTGAVLQSESAANGITQFRRVEDGQWDPTNPNHFYFVTTDQFGGITRLWRLEFADVLHPELGGTIEIAIDSPAGVPGEMFDNMTVDASGRVLLQEDPGNNAYLAKIWVFEPDTGDLTEVAHANPAEFSAAGSLDEESSGIIDVSDILGPGMYLFDVQAHRPPKYNGATAAEHVEDGQLLAMRIDFAE